MKTISGSTIETNPVESSNISAIGYDASSKTVAVRFSSGGLYHYLNVDPGTFEEFAKAKSLGHFFYQNIRNNYETVKVKEEQGE